MTPKRPKSALRSHDVRNQVPPWQGYSLFETDPLLSSWVARSEAAWATDALQDFGARLGAPETWEWARQANAHPPELLRFDRCGHRLDEVRYHPAYHQLMHLACDAGVANVAWRAPVGGHQAHAAMEYMLCQVEAGVCCPVTMSYAAAPVLAQHDAMAGLHEKLLKPAYDPSHQPMAQKHALTVGMAMTEKQGGSDLRGSTTRAEASGDGGYHLTGHKWFCSAPMSDAFLTLAQTPGGLTCFLLPRWHPDGSRNGLEFQRLKDKLGNRSNASSEVEFIDAWAQRLGEEGRGIATIIDMVHHTRLDCALAAAGLMRQALVQALHHARHRRAFSKRLIEHDLMARVLSDLALEVEASALLAWRMAELCDAARGDESLVPLARLGVAVAKYWNNKRCPLVVVEAMECLGGAGYIEESLLPRLYREAPLNGIWEGSGNVICLDVLRTFARAADLPELLREELGPSVDPFLREVASAAPHEARYLVGALARLWQERLLARYRSEAVAEVFAQARRGSYAFGEALPQEHVQDGLTRILPEGL